MLNPAHPTYTLECSSRTQIGFVYKSIRVPLVETDLAILADHFDLCIDAKSPFPTLTTLEHIAFSRLSRVFRAILNNESGSLKSEAESELSNESKI